VTVGELDEHHESAVALDQRGDGGHALAAEQDALDVPRRWRAPPRFVFVDSMSDLFHPAVPDQFIDQVLDVMHQTPQHTYQLLTKRLATLAGAMDWPPNLWVGVSVESDPYTFRARHLAQVTGAPIWFLSVEPLLGPLPSLDLDGIDWVIVGGESGPNHRPVDPSSVRDLRDRAVAAGVPFFFKQWGGHTPRPTAVASTAAPGTSAPPALRLRRHPRPGPGPAGPRAAGAHAVRGMTSANSRSKVTGNACAPSWPFLTPRLRTLK
jgi:protein gp37